VEQGPQTHQNTKGNIMEAKPDNNFSINQMCVKLECILNKYTGLIYDENYVF
jgi:hypothetical protein